MPAASASSSAAGKSVDPAVAHERLEADDAALGELVEAVEVAGDDAAPQREVDDRGRARGRRAFASNAAPSIVGGWALSGISMQAVAPPAASARVPVAQPSQSVRPGSLKCTCASITPGRRWSERASISSRAGPEANAAIAPSWIATSRSAAWITRSYGT